MAAPSALPPASGAWGAGYLNNKSHGEPLAAHRATAYHATRWLLPCSSLVPSNIRRLVGTAPCACTACMLVRWRVSHEPRMYRHGWQAVRSAVMLSL